MNKQLITIRKNNLSNMSLERNLEVYHQAFAQYYKSTPKMRS